MKMFFTLNDAELTEIVTFSLDFGKRYVEFEGTAKDGIHPQLFIAERSLDTGLIENRSYIVLTGFNEAFEKQAVLRKIGGELAATKVAVAGACLLCEAWQAHEPAGLPKSLHVQPRDNPNRTEVMIAVATTLDGNCVGGRHPITRLRGNIVLGDREMNQPKEMKFPLLNHLWDAYVEGMKRWAAIFASGGKAT